MLSIKEMIWHLYLLRCSDDTVYTGIARDVDARLRAHAAGRGARYTRGRGPLRLIAQARCQSHSEALRLEYSIKQLSRTHKLRLAKPRRLAAFVLRYRTMKRESTD